MAKNKRELILPTPVIDTHCHLDYLKEKELCDILAESHRVGVEKIITISVTPENLDHAYRLASENNDIYCSQGIHPHNAKDFTLQVKEKIAHHCSNQKVVAIGEIGLDYYYNNSPREKQITAFEEQIQLASDLNLPVIIHSRDADDDMISVLKNFSNKLICKGVIHSFTSTRKLAQYCLEDGYYLGFNGIITFNKADNVREIVQMTPIDKILSETDAPFLTPTPYRGVENSPYYLPFVIEKISELKELNIDEMSLITTENAKKLFQKIL